MVDKKDGRSAQHPTKDRPPEGQAARQNEKKIVTETKDADGDKVSVKDIRGGGA